MGERSTKPRVRWEKNTRTEVHEDSRTARARTKSEQRRLAVQEELDDLLDEVDEVLEENAEEFVKSFVQKGGE